jgi:ADP-ribose pyrophosphatase YjhB (NUDIX family)
MMVNVRAVIWSGDRLVVHARQQQGEERITLPGGRVKDRETTEAALRREVLEEIDVAVVVGPLLYVAEVVSPYSMQNLELIFQAEPAEGQTLSGQTTIDPRDVDRDSVLPPIVDVIWRDRADGPAGTPRWLGNIHVPGVVA